MKSKCMEITMKHPFGWDLPPGVTQRMIDESVGGDDPSELENIEAEIARAEEGIRRIEEQIKELKQRLIDLIGGERD
jgi:hypothetical protein